MNRFARLSRSALPTAALVGAAAQVCVAAGALLPGTATAQQVEVAATLAFTEGPAADAAGNVYFSDIVSQRILRLGSDGMVSVYRDHSNAANGLLIDPQGRLIACEGGALNLSGVSVGGTPRITRTDLKTGKIEILADRYAGQPFVAPNDVTMDDAGRIYFTDYRGSAVYRIDAPGKVVRLLSAPDVRLPNGIQISPDGRTLYLVDSNPQPGGLGVIRKYDLRPDGSIHNMRVHYEFSAGRGADGISIDVAGNLYASAGLNRQRGNAETPATKAGIYVISPEGKLLSFTPILEDLVTNNAFGGPDMKTLYVTAGKTLYRLRTATPGLAR